MKELPPIPCRKVMLKVRMPMSAEGLSHFNPKFRPKVYKFAFKCLGSFMLPYERCLSRRDFALWIYEQIGHSGIVVDIFSWRKGYFAFKHRLRPIKIATLRNTIDENGEIFTEYLDLSRISKFKWFEPHKQRENLRRKDKNDFNLPI